MSEVKEQDFFGGAIRGVVPQNWVDASNLREIPDHQELFLSRDTLSNLIIEINQRASQEEALSTLATLSQQQPSLLVGSGSATSATPETVDQAAALYHLHDLCEEGDSMHVVELPKRVTLGRLASNAPPGSSISAYRGIVEFKSVPRRRDQRVPAVEPGAAVAGVSMDSAPATNSLTCHFLLVRLEAQETDLLTFFNVPHQEFDKGGDAGGLSKEESTAEDVMKSVEEKMQILDWGLFV
ncbi:Mog1/PsbP alpha/beta/alpha sandwich [Penicillium odoratum]|uniref:Mog1/PsbP alpha/beta/alpha sandwich n=1 Tax=Penicillium odoratum TaxID=1167516 RepID=UPI00254980AD|nr:Mog1/PsbP alpha/beta/alpha sandwich [Penicillium odoratum]KAJ5777962.1 Mog1/PsbP alpha/beta/alpha sandwich [Penicillium odoratum]